MMPSAPPAQPLAAVARQLNTVAAGSLSGGQTFLYGKAVITHSMFSSGDDDLYLINWMEMARGWQMHLIAEDGLFNLVTGATASGHSTRPIVPATYLFAWGDPFRVSNVLFGDGHVLTRYELENYVDRMGAHLAY